MVENARFAQLTTVGPEGQLLSRPLAVQKRDFDGDLWFFTADPSPKTDQIAVNDQVNVSLQVADDGFVSIAGTAEVSHDETMIEGLWNPTAEAWFENGREDPAVALLRVHADTAEYWTVDDPKVVHLVKYAKAVVTGSEPDVGENATVKL